MPLAVVLALTVKMLMSLAGNAEEEREVVIRLNKKRKGKLSRARWEEGRTKERWSRFNFILSAS